MVSVDEGGNLFGYDAMKSNFQDLNWLEFCTWYRFSCKIVEE